MGSDIGVYQEVGGGYEEHHGGEGYQNRLGGRERARETRRELEREGGRGRVVSHRRGRGYGTIIPPSAVVMMKTTTKTKYHMSMFCLHPPPSNSAPDGTVSFVDNGCQSQFIHRLPRPMAWSSVGVGVNNAITVQLQCDYSA